MNIGLHDSDKTNFPNLALMKLSAYHKSIGDNVEWWNPLLSYDRVYSSKVFTFTPECQYLPENTIRGGTGYGIMDELPQEIDDMFPDYSIYPKCDYAIGFLTRGCIRHCPWCIVPKKEGEIRPYQSWQEIKRPDSNKIVFMDNNILACDHGLAQIQSMIGENIKVDFNQGLDARLITDEVAEMLSKLHWIRFIRMSADTDSMLDVVLTAIDKLWEYGVKPSSIFVYVLVQDIESAERRCVELRKIGANPFAQPYRDFSNSNPPQKILREFARWVNRKEIFKSVKTFSEYQNNYKHSNKKGEHNEHNLLCL